MVHFNTSKKINNKENHQAYTPAEFNITPEFYNSILKDSDKNYNKVAAEAALQRVKDSSIFDNSSPIEAQNLFKQYYNEEVERRSGIKFEEFTNILKNNKEISDLLELNSNQKNVFQNVVNHIAKNVFAKSDNDFKDGLLNKTEQKNGISNFKQNLQEIAKDNFKILKLSKDIYSNMDERIIEVACEQTFASPYLKELESVMSSDKKELSTFLYKIDDIEDNAKFIKKELPNIKEEAYIPNGKFDREAIQTIGSCDPHGLINSCIKHKKGREYLKSLRKIHEDGSIEIFLPGIQKSYTFTPEDLAIYSFASSLGEGDITAYIAAIAEARKEQGCSTWGGGREGKNAELTAMKLLFNIKDPYEGVSVEINKNINLTINEIENIVPFSSLDEKDKTLTLKSGLKDATKRQDKYFINSEYEVTEVISSKEINVKLADGSTITVDATTLNKMHANWDLKNNFDKSKEKANTLFENCNYKVLEVKDVENITVQIANNPETVVITKEELTKMHSTWEKEETEREKHRAFEKEFQDFKAKFESGDYAYAPGIKKQEIIGYSADPDKDSCVKYFSKLVEVETIITVESSSSSEALEIIETDVIEGKDDKGLLAQCHAYALVDVIDKDHLILKESNCPDNLITVTYEEFKKMNQRVFSIPEPIQW